MAGHMGVLPVSHQKCDDCKKSGATVGCEVKRCTKSFHFPCAIGAGAETVEDEEGRYA